MSRATILMALLGVSGVAFAAAETKGPTSRPASRRVTPLPDLPVPPGGWSSMNPNPKVAAMPDNSWMVLETTFVPKGATSFRTMKFGADYRKLGHPKTEVCLVYDEARNVTIWFGGCSAGYTNQTLLLSVSDATWYQAQPEHVDFLRKGKNVPPKFAVGRPHGQCSYGACYDSHHRLYIKGMGICSGWPYDVSTWAYDVSRNRWQRLAGWDTGGTGRTGCYKMVYDRDHKVVVLFGGLSTGERKNDTWLFDVAKRQWRQAKVTGPAPAGRFYQHMVYDEKHKKVVLFGGEELPYSSHKFLNDTWTFDAATGAWTEMKPKVSPPGRKMGAMAYDSANGICILVGGRVGQGLKNCFSDTWAYDLAANEWKDMKPPGQPTYYGLFQAAYDRVNNVTVYFSREGKTCLYRYRATPLPVPGVRPVAGQRLDGKSRGKSRFG